MKALKVIGIALCLALLLVSGVATGAQGPYPDGSTSSPRWPVEGPLASGSGGCAPGDSYDPVCDVNRDNVIDIVDIMLVASKWQRSGTWTSDTWSLTGNPNTTPGTHFLGTTDDVTLEVRVNNQGALRMEPTTSTPNLIGGYSGNSVADGVVGATIGGGGQAGATNGAATDFATVGGGKGNTASGHAATIGGGEANAVLGFAATVGGGANNVAGNVAGNANFATVSGGIANTASNEHATVGGGISNVASGKRATVPGGHENTAAGDYSFAAGLRAQADHDGAFVWGDSTDAEIHSGNDDQFVVRANGGLWFGAVTTDITPTIASSVLISTSTGAYLSSGGAWTNASDRNAKANVKPVNEQELLSRLEEIPIATWNYKSQDPPLRHIGPMAQDFHAAFGVGEDETHISTLDADGVALAAIQGLYQLVQEQAAQIADLEARLTALEAASANSTASAQPLRSGLLTGAGVLLAGLGLVWVNRRWPA